MFYYKRGNCTLAVKSEPKKIVEEEIEKNGKTIKVKKTVFDDSCTPITEDEYKEIIKSRHHKK